MKEFLFYTLMRIVLFFAAWGVILGVWALVTQSREVPLLVPLVIAFLVSGVASYYLLQGPRSAFARRLESGTSKAREKLDEQRAKEDE